MRVVAGKLGGRNFEAPHGHRTHPMSDKARGGLFNSLGDVEELTFLDAFAGSGALAFEALSHGAAHVVAIDIDKSAHETIKKNAFSLGVGDQMNIIRANASGWSDNNPDARYDIVIAAPPYDDLQPKLVNKLTRHVKDSGLFVLDWPASELPLTLDGLEQVAKRRYGDAQVIFYKKR